MGSASAQHAPVADSGKGLPQPREYLWYEAENMQGFTAMPNGEPLLNPSWMVLSRDRAPGWGINGPGVSAEWSQGGESEWNSAAAAADETQASIFQDIEIPRAGAYRVLVRYADWVGKSENFTARVVQGLREPFRREFGAHDLVDLHDETAMYWGWAFVWDGAPASFEKGPARLYLEIEKAAGARRHIDCLLITNDLQFIPNGRYKPDFAALRYLRQYAKQRPTLEPLSQMAAPTTIPAGWKRQPLAGRDFLVPWNIAKEFWNDYDKPAANHPLYPFNAEPIDEFIKKYSGAAEVPIFSSNLVVPVIYLNDLPGYLKEGSPFLRYLRKTHQPFAILINYGAAQFAEAEGQAAWKLLTGELRGQFLGWVSGESVGYVSPDAAQDLKRSSIMSRRELLEAYHQFYTRALAKKWSQTFHTQIGPDWEKLIPAQSTSSTSFAHALGEWGVRLIGMETPAVQPATAMRIAFTRGAARQYGGDFLYYHAPNFGDTATTFTRVQNFAGPDNFYHSRYGASMGPSLSWYRKSYYLYYMGGASAIYLEQGFDQFFKPGPGEHPFQLNPLGRITDEFMTFAARHPDRGTPYTPIAFLLDQAHGWDMTEYPQWPFGVSRITRHDRALRELFGAAYYPQPVTEGEPATADRQAFVNAIFGDIFDVLVTSQTEQHSIDNYRVVIAGGHIDWSREWANRLADYVKRGGVVLINAAQTANLPADLLGVRISTVMGESDDAHCLAPGESATDLSGQLFRYQRVEAVGDETRILMRSSNGDPLVTIRNFGRGRLIFCALPDLLGEDERLVPFAAHLLAHLCAEATPVHVDGDAEYLINRNDSGWVVTLINNNGVYKRQQGLAEVDRQARVEVKVSLRGEETIQSASDWIENKQLEIVRRGGQSSVGLDIPPGGISIIELRTAKP